jgi:hypothetical protein
MSQPPVRGFFVTCFLESRVPYNLDKKHALKRKSKCDGRLQRVDGDEMSAPYRH